MPETDPRLLPRIGDQSLTWARPGSQAPETITLTSPAFDDGGPIPQRHASEDVGDNISPALQWTGIPGSTAELVLIVEDPDVPRPTRITHAVVTGIEPSRDGLAEGEINAGAPHGHGTGSFGRVGYFGPRPIPGHGPHHYHFQLYAIDVPLAIPTGADPDTVNRAIDGHVIARGRLVGTYERFLSDA